MFNVIPNFVNVSLSLSLSLSFNGDEFVPFARSARGTLDRTGSSLFCAWLIQSRSVII